MWALCDAHNFHWISQWNWCAWRTSSNSRWYAVRSVRLSNGKRAMQYMHRVIMGVTDPNVQVDHKDRTTTLDNRESNLRVATHAQNQQNQGLAKHNTSSVKGVSWYKPYSKWVATIQVNKRRVFLGYFDMLLEAARVYNEAAMIYHGAFAYQNDLSQVGAALRAR